MNPILTKSYLAEAAIAACRIVKFGTGDGVVIQAAAAADASIGISEQIASDSGDRVDVIHSGIGFLEMAGVVARGGPITSDTVGRGVAAAPATGANARVIGFALVTSASGDIIPVQLAPHIMQGA